MPSQNYFNANKASQKNLGSGLKQKAYVCPTSWITTPATYPGSGVGGAQIQSTTDHIFTPVSGDGSGFLEMYAGRDTASMEYATSGEPGMLNGRYTFTLFLPGDHADLQVMLNKIKNEDLMVLVEDAACPGGPVWQLGCSCGPCVIIDIKMETGTRKEGKKGYTLKLEADCRLQYMGLIEVFTP